MKLKDALTEKVISIQADAPIDDAIRLLEQHYVRHLPVVRDQEPVGIVTAGDILATVGGLLSDERVSAMDATVPYAGPTVVEQIMRKSIITLSPEDSIAAGARAMLNHHISAVILVSGEKMEGIVTEADYLQRFFDDSTVIPESCRQQPVADHMASELVTTEPSETVFALIREMGGQIRHLPVVQDGKLVGILSDHDIRQALAIDKIEQILEPDFCIRLMEDFDAGRIMNRDVETIAPTQTLGDAARKMIENRVGALPVTDESKLLGIITETDILRVCVETLEDSA